MIALWGGLEKSIVGKDVEMRKMDKTYKATKSKNCE